MDEKRRTLLLLLLLPPAETLGKRATMIISILRTRYDWRMNEQTLHIEWEWSHELNGAKCNEMRLRVNQWSTKYVTDQTEEINSNHDWTKIENKDIKSTFHSMQSQSINARHLMYFACLSVRAYSTDFLCTVNPSCIYTNRTTQTILTVRYRVQDDRIGKQQ